MGKQHPINRRTALKATAAIAGISGIPNVVGAVDSSPDFKDIVRNSYRQLDNGATIEDRDEYLRDHGFNVHSNKKVVTIDRYIGDSSEEEVGPDSIGTESFTKDEIQFSSSIIRENSGHYHAGFEWKYEWDDGTGFVPKDRVGLGFESQWWDWGFDNIYSTTETSDNVSVDEGNFGAGAAFTVKDENGDPGDYEWAGVYVEPVGDYGESERRIQPSYVHLWNHVQITGISVGWPAGISVDVTTTESKWKAITDQDGDFLQVSQEDAEWIGPIG